MFATRALTASSTEGDGVGADGIGTGAMMPGKPGSGVSETEAGAVEPVEAVAHPAASSDIANAATQMTPGFRTRPS